MGMRDSLRKKFWYLIAVILFGPVLPGVISLGQSSAGGSFSLQLEAFSRPEVAVRRVDQLRQSGVEAYLVKSEVAGRGVLWRVRIGRFTTSAQARQRGLELQARGLTTDFFVARWEPPFREDAPPPAAPAPSPSPAAGASNAAPSSAAPKSGHVTAKSENHPTGRTPTPAPARTSTPVPPAPPPSPVATRSYVRFTDRTIGYELDRPVNWEGGPLGQKETTAQNINSGALFRSVGDNAFLNIIWNQLDQANSQDHDNNMIVEVILRSMRSGEGTRELREVGRRVVTENGMIKTFLDLRARFESPGINSRLDFSGKAVIARGRQGILLVVTFYSSAAPADLPTVAERILTSVIVP